MSPEPSSSVLVSLTANIRTFSFCLPSVLDCGVLSPRYHLLGTCYLPRLTDHGRSTGRKIGKAEGGVEACHITVFSGHDRVVSHKTTQCLQLHAQNLHKLKHDLGRGSQSLTLTEWRVSSLWGSKSKSLESVDHSSGWLHRSTAWWLNRLRGLNKKWVYMSRVATWLEAGAAFER